MENYGKYTSTERITVTNRDFYTDNDGYPNEKAFWDFARHITQGDKMYLLCLDVDLNASNAKGTGFGDLVLRTFFTRMQSHFPAFRMRGTKFNVFVPESDVQTAEEMLTTDNSKVFTLYGEILKDKFVSCDNIDELLKEGIPKMFVGRKDTDKIFGDKGNVPAEQQETDTKKYLSTMWYARIVFRETKPSVRTLTAYVFPTEYKPPMALLETVVVLDDVVKPRVYEGTMCKIPIDGMMIKVTSRFDHDGHLAVSWSKGLESKEGIIDGEVEIHEGNSIPVNFGKRISKSREIYPIKPNAQGLYEYVLYDKTAEYPKRKAEYVTSGTIRGKVNNYEVHMDSTVIELVKV